MKMPENELDLRDGSVLKAVEDYPWFNLEKGQCFKITFDGKFIRILGGKPGKSREYGLVHETNLGSPTWYIESLVEEIRKGVWEIVQ